MVGGWETSQRLDSLGRLKAEANGRDSCKSWRVSRDCTGTRNTGDAHRALLGRIVIRRRVEGVRGRYLGGSAQGFLTIYIGRHYTVAFNDGVGLRNHSRLQRLRY